MIDALFNQPTYVAAKKMLDATVLRQEAIASNLANLETPNYKRLDVAPSFEAQLSQAVKSGDAAQIASLQPKLAVDALGRFRPQRRQHRHPGIGNVEAQPKHVRGRAGNPVGQRSLAQTAPGHHRQITHSDL